MQRTSFPLRVRLLVVQAFGVIGLVIGPLVFSQLMSIIDIYRHLSLHMRWPIARLGQQLSTITQFSPGVIT